MNLAGIEKCLAEIERFEARAKTLQGLVRSGEKPEPRWTLYDWPREQGALRRASMDLTRALADLRAGR